MVLHIRTAIHLFNDYINHNLHGYDNFGTQAPLFAQLALNYKVFSKMLV